MRGGRGEGGERRGAAAAAERCNAKRVLLGGEGALVGVHTFLPLHTLLPVHTLKEVDTLREGAAAAAAHVVDPPKADAALQSSEGALVEGAHPPPCAHSHREVHRSKEVHTLGWCTPQRGVASTSQSHAHSSTAQTNHAHVLHSCAVTCRLLRSVHRKLGWLLALKSYKPW